MVRNKLYQLKFKKD